MRWVGVISLRLMEKVWCFLRPLSFKVLITQGKNPDTTQKFQPVVFHRVFFPLKLYNKLFSSIGGVNFASENCAFLSFFHWKRGGAFYDPLSFRVLITQGKNPDTTQKIQLWYFAECSFHWNCVINYFHRSAGSILLLKMVHFCRFFIFGTFHEVYLNF